MLGFNGNGKVYVFLGHLGAVGGEFAKNSPILLYCIEENERSVLLLLVVSYLLCGGNDAAEEILFLFEHLFAASESALFS